MAKGTTYLERKLAGLCVRCRRAAPARDDANTCERCTRAKKNYDAIRYLLRRGHMLRKLTIELRDDGKFHMLREMVSPSGERTGDRWVCEDLMEAFATVRCGFLPNGENRPTMKRAMPRQSTETKGE